MIEEILRGILNSFRNPGLQMEAILQQVVVVVVCLWGPLLKPTSEQISSHYH